MARVIIDMSPSLDGFVAGEGVTIDAPFGDAGHRLHRWLGMDGGVPEAADDEAARRMFANAGAVVIGRRMFDVGIGHWGEDGAFGLPCFVATHRSREPLQRGATRFVFVTDGVEAAMARACNVAGERDVIVAGGAGVARQCLAAGLVDELRLHVVPVLLGRGTRLFDAPMPRCEAEPLDLVRTGNAVHQSFRVLKPGPAA